MALWSLALLADAVGRSYIKLNLLLYIPRYVDIGLRRLSTAAAAAHWSHNVYTVVRRPIQLGVIVASSIVGYDVDHSCIRVTV